LSVLEAVILGIVQGFTEFLPVSSSGHLNLLQKVFGIEEPALTFDIFLHMATLIPVLFIFWKDIWKLIKKPFQKTTYLLIVGTLPLVAVAVFFKGYIDALFQSGALLGVCFLITGLILMAADSAPRGHKNLDTMKYTNALFVGIIQAIAVIPAISRSGSTIGASLFAGLDRESAARFAFLLSIPAILGGMVMEVKAAVTEGADFFALGLIPMWAGFAAAVICGFIAIKIMLKVIKTKRLIYFSYYVLVLGTLIIFDQTFFRFFF
jgi:undecaprenyl-diphosphatase